MTTRRPLSAHVTPTSNATVRVSLHGPVVTGGPWRRVGQWYGSRTVWNEVAAGLRLRGHELEEVETAGDRLRPTRHARGHRVA